MNNKINLTIEYLTNFKNEIKFPNKFINIEGACILSRRKRSNIYDIKEGIIAKAYALYILDNVYYDPYQIWEYNDYSILLNCKYPVNFKSFTDHCKYLVIEYKDKLRNIISNTIDPNCDVKNVTQLITDFYSGIDNIFSLYLIHYYYDDFQNKYVLTYWDTIKFTYNNIVNPFVIYPKKDSKIYLGIFLNDELISLSDEIFIDPRYFYYKHKNNYMYLEYSD